MGGGEERKNTERERKRDRQTVRQTDRQTDRNCGVCVIGRTTVTGSGLRCYRFFTHVIRYHLFCLVLFFCYVTVLIRLYLSLFVCCIQAVSAIMTGTENGDSENKRNKSILVTFLLDSAYLFPECKCSIFCVIH